MEPTMRYASLGGNSYAPYVKIEEETTPEQFDIKCQLKQGYVLGRFYQYKNALGYAAEKGNLKLISHIVKIGEKNLINLGNSNGYTSLFWCIFRAAYKDNREDNFINVSEKAHIICPTLLCELGADVNLANTFGGKDAVLGKIPKGVTALWVAAEKTTRIDLVKMLLKYGGDERVCGKLSEPGRAMIIKAKKEIIIDMFNENKVLMKALKDLDYTFNVFPKELKDMIMMTTLITGKWRPFLLKV